MRRVAFPLWALVWQRNAQRMGARPALYSSRTRRAGCRTPAGRVTKPFSGDGARRRGLPRQHTAAAPGLNSRCGKRTLFWLKQPLPTHGEHTLHAHAHTHAGCAIPRLGQPGRAGVERQIHTEARSQYCVSSAPATGHDGRASAPSAPCYHHAAVTDRPSGHEHCPSSAGWQRAKGTWRRESRCHLRLGRRQAPSQQQQQQQLYGGSGPVGEGPAGAGGACVGRAHRRLFLGHRARLLRKGDGRPREGRVPAQRARVQHHAGGHQAVGRQHRRVSGAGPPARAAGVGMGGRKEGGGPGTECTRAWHVGIFRQRGLCQAPRLWHPRVVVERGGRNREKGT